jgi:ribonuclease HI
MTGQQLSIFTTDHQTTPVHWTLFVDGASRSNPGPAGAGIELLKEGNSVARKGFFLGVKTNNQAEYLALLLGLFVARKYMQQHDKLKIITDSELLVKQFKGEYRVRNPELKKLNDRIRELLRGMHYTISHVVRAQNKIADKLANKAIDEKFPLPSDFSP